MDPGTATQEQIENAVGGVESFANIDKDKGDDFGYQPLNNEEELPLNQKYINNPYDEREDRQHIQEDPGSIYVQNKSDERYNFVHHPATVLGNGQYLDKDEWDRLHW